MLGRWLKSPAPEPTTRRRAVEELVRSLALIVQPDALRQALAGRVRELVQCDDVVFLGFRPEHEVFVAQFSTEPLPDIDRLRFASDGPLVKWLRVNEEPFVIPHPRGAFDYLEPGEQAILTGLGARVCVPLLAGTRPTAILVITSRDPTWNLSEDDFELLRAMSRWVGLAIENAELQRVERDRLRDLHRAEQLAVAGHLAATVAHEIRNPLTAIRSTIQYAVGGNAADWPARRQLLKEVLVEVDRIEQTVGGMLALSRPHAVDHCDVDLVQIAEEALLLVHAYARSHGIAIERQFDEPALPVAGDARELHQVCINLLLNACQAMPDGGQLTLRSAFFQEGADSNPLALLQIRDTGTGIAPEHLQKIFDPFFTTKRAGTGLGLPICLEIVTRHEGQLRLDSQADGGTTATVLLPLR
jgi:signal transduction histidine kinase